ncbi:MAG: hypothetical protein A2512_01390 [Deltaproteobacteria bacterium RIFOXYD12_FULL_56_24]|nr:MAG: hypothetical protein A2512_01390 [Deltaproteobacteria bacterium RIFOXYD12_FULL_56_24]
MVFFLFLEQGKDYSAPLAFLLTRLHMAAFWTIQSPSSLVNRRATEYCPDRNLYTIGQTLDKFLPKKKPAFSKQAFYTQRV